MPQEAPNGRARLAVRIQPNTTLVLQLLYKNGAPSGVCQVDLHGPVPGVMDTARTECGLDLHRYEMPGALRPGGHYVELLNENGKLIRTYFFDVTL
ncbi:MAG: hypothetical protein HYX27_26275 [Acidobacteria bacterium]|nr:hypothetical protein [Acidobacteriota bacterium]